MPASSAIPAIVKVYPLGAVSDIAFAGNLNAEELKRFHSWKGVGGECRGPEEERPRILAILTASGWKDSNEFELFYRVWCGKAL